MSEITLLESQANRCKKILFNLSKNPQNIKDTFLQKTTLSNLAKINFEKFKKNNVILKISINNYQQEEEPIINFSDEIMYGIGNIIQNASQHAKKIIKVNISWNRDFLFINIIDDGKGFTKAVLDKIGNPFISDNISQNNLGLGIFIAKNLIENADGKIEFSNYSKNNGAIVEIILNRKN